MSRSRVTDLHAGERLTKAPFMLAQLQESTDRNGNAYLRITLRDQTGDVEARYWRVPPGVVEQLVVGEGVAANGQVEDYRGALQIRVLDIVPHELKDLAEYLPASPATSQPAPTSGSFR